MALTQDEAGAIVEHEELIDSARSEVTDIDARRIDVAQWGNELTDIVEQYPEIRRSDYKLFIKAMLDKKMGIGFIESGDLRGFKRQFFRTHIEWAHLRGRRYDKYDRMFITSIRPLYYMMLSGSVRGQERRLHFSALKELQLTGGKKPRGWLQRHFGG